MLVSATSFIIVLGVIIFIHEFGHYYAARKCGVRVEEFSLGFGKVLWGRKDKAGTYWKIRAIPLGGFVKMYGDKNAASMTDQEFVDSMNAAQKKEAFSTQPLLNKAFIVGSGPLANFLLAVVIFASLYFVYGKIEIDPVVGSVMSSSPAEVAGIKAGDVIIKLGDLQIKAFTDLRQVVLLSPNQELSMEIQRGGEVISLKVTPMPKDQIGFIGVSPDLDKVKHVSVGVFDSILLAVRDTYVTSVAILDSIYDMIFGSRSTEHIGGIVSVAKESGRALSQGSLLLFIAFVSINIGLMNLLPIPILDGGHLLFLLYEAVVGKKMTSKIESIAYLIGMALIIFLVVISTLNDIKSLLF